MTKTSYSGSDSMEVAVFSTGSSIGIAENQVVQRLKRAAAMGKYWIMKGNVDQLETLLTLWHSY